MQRLAEILKSCPVVPDELQPSTSSSWSLRQSAAQERWKEARPYHLKCLLDTEAVGQELCCRCSQAAVIRCTDCLPADWLLESLPSEWFCEDCDVFEHRSRPLHNRDSIVDGFLKAIPPSTVFKKTEADKYTTLEQARVDMLTIHAMGWNQRKSENLHQALATRYVKTCQKAVEEAARLSELKEELNCSEEMALQWTADVQQWAICDTTDTITDPAQQTLQQSIEGLFVSIHQRKHSLYRQNDSNKLRHRLRQKLAEEKRRLFDQIRRYNTLAAEDKIDEALIEGRLAGLGSGTEAQIWPWDANISGSSVSITTKKKIHDQQMLTMRLQEERSILVVEMAQHCTSLQNLALALRTKISREEGRFQLALQYYTAALGPCSSLLGNVDEEEECDCSPDVSEEEEEEEEEADDKTP
ncbi:hypothetical protein SKAU_G00094000 [Synaphobranchus kaupii]|uniref:Uncharacterized protein n=1 Tax=Synaphobranchus kaupii TaxID=118154 RepID=A0A9Q1FXF5_SYNKA|nr:hypothetical protein SKAU_G00094000 [Synaphobranchus kaupii]